METYAFLHFTINTFTDKEWGYGDESPSLFQPAQFDADAIVEALRDGGMKGVILTCKHHDGFCLWPTRTTEHSVRNTSWRGGQADIVGELAKAAARQKMKFGVYLSPWDRNHPAYATPAYIDVYRAQLRELLTNYGPIFEVWHDGANGGDGFYGGAREKRRIDKRSYYDWPKTWDLVRTLQPDAVIFSDVGPDIRWVGNEKGFAGETCWATYDPVGEDGGPATPGNTKYREGESGHRNAKHWLPAECDVSIRPGWFWHEKENAKVKTPAQLMDLYFKSVGRGASFLLNVPPDRRGLLHEADVASLRAFGAQLKSMFRDTVASRAAVKRSPTEHTLTFKQPVKFNLIRLREQIALGQRIDRIAIDQWQAGQWSPCAEATSIGNCRLIRLPQPIETTKVRLRIVESAAPPLVSEFSLYLDPTA